MKENKISRRQFLIGSTLAGAGLAASSALAGTALAAGSGSAPASASGSASASASASKSASSSAEAAAKANAYATAGGTSTSTMTAEGNEILTLDSKEMITGTWSWTTAPEAIAADSIANTVECDVLVIGSGLAGCCAALASLEEGVNTIVIDKNQEGTIAARGLDIAAFHTKVQQDLVDKGLMEEPDYRQTIRRWIMWAQGRVKEPLLWEFARKSGACFDWMYDMVTPHNLSCYIWDGYYKGPDYTELPVTHAFYLTDKEKETFDFTFYTTDDVFGNVVLVPVLYDLIAEKGGTISYDQKSVRLLRDGDGPCTGCIAQDSNGGYTQYNAKSVVIATGDYASNREMVQCYAPVSNYATDKYVYMPSNANNGELHQQAMWIGGAMQKSTPHASVTHLDFGAASYGFLHVNGEGRRYKNEDVNTQSKSITKSFQPTKQAYTIYDSTGLEAVKAQVDGGIGGGLQWGQLTQAIGHEYNLEAQQQVLKDEVEAGLTYQADTLEDLAAQIGCDPDVFKETVDRYNQMCDAGNDTDFGKRAEILVSVKEPPFYAGHLQACLLTMCGGLRTDTECHVLDVDDNPIEGLYVCGSAQGDFFGAGDYPTFVAGIGHGKCVTFGRIAGINAAGGDAESEITSLDI